MLSGRQHCPVWMAPFLQVPFCGWRFVRSSLVFGLFARRTWPLALMVSTNQVPFRTSNSKRSGQSMGRLGFRADKVPSRHWSCKLLLLGRCVKRFSLCMARCGSVRPRSYERFCWPWRQLLPCLACAIRCGTVRYFVCEAHSRHWLTNHSPNMTANWVLASTHSRGGRFQSCAAWLRTRYSSFEAASSPGK